MPTAVYTEITIQRIKDLEAQMDELQGFINSIKKAASCVANDGKFRVSNDSWRKRNKEMINELTKFYKTDYPTSRSVLIVIYIKLRDVYGVVLEQLKKDYQRKYDTLRWPSAFEAISADDAARDTFEAVLLGLFPENYWENEI